MLTAATPNTTAIAMPLPAGNDLFDFFIAVISFHDHDYGAILRRDRVSIFA
jgi:hypothetical protein